MNKVRWGYAFLQNFITRLKDVMKNAPTQKP